MQFTGKVCDVSIDVKSKLPKITFTINEKDALEQIDEILSIEKLTVEAKKYRNQRSLDANAYFHVLVNKLARATKMSDSEMKVRMNLEYGSIARNLDNTKVGIKVPYGTNVEQFYPYCKKFGECIENNMTFEKYLLYKQTHELDTKEMSDLIQGVEDECRRLGIETKSKEEVESMLKEWGKK